MTAETPYEITTEDLEHDDAVALCAAIAELARAPWVPWSILTIRRKLIDAGVLVEAPKERIYTVVMMRRSFRHYSSSSTIDRTGVIELRVVSAVAPAQAVTQALSSTRELEDVEVVATREGRWTLGAS